MATTDIPVSGLVPEADTGRPVVPADERRQTQPIVWWALIGFLCLAFEAYVMIRWVSGPYFKRVPSGPSVPPTWMKAVLIGWQAVGIPVALGLIYWFLMRPLRRDRRISIDGLLCLSFFLVAWQDPLSSYFNHWYTYNSYLVNMGSWVKEIPGWMSYSAPGRMDVEPIIWTPFMYVYLFFAASVFGCWLMRRASERWPRMGNLELLGIAMVAGMIVDVIAEGLLIMPAGIYTYAGGHLAIFPHAYHKFPLTEPLTVGSIFAGLAGLRFFVDDKGHTMVERGVEKLKLSRASKDLLRFGAIFGMCNVLVMCCYNIPNGILGAHSTAWPADIQQRSYLTDYLCGQGTDRACPGPSVPLTRGNGSAYLNRDGKLVFPPGAKAPRPLPFKKHSGGPFSGPVF
jgi:Spirocyclase AveC-like